MHMTLLMVVCLYGGTNYRTDKLQFVYSTFNLRPITYDATLKNKTSLFTHANRLFNRILTTLQFRIILP